MLSVVVVVVVVMVWLVGWLVGRLVSRSVGSVEDGGRSVDCCLMVGRWVGCVGRSVVGLVVLVGRSVVVLCRCVVRSLCECLFFSSFL